MEVAHIASKLIVLYTGIFPTYHVKCFPRDSSIIVSFTILHHCLVHLPAAFVLPTREALCLGDRVVMYLPRCADTNSEVRKVSAEVGDWLAALMLSNKFNLCTALPTVIESSKSIGHAMSFPIFSSSR